MNSLLMNGVSMIPLALVMRAPDEQLVQRCSLERMKAVRDTMQARVETELKAA